MMCYIILIPRIKFNPYNNNININDKLDALLNSKKGRRTEKVL